MACGPMVLAFIMADKGMEDHRISLTELQSLARPEVLALKLPPTRHDQTLTPMEGSAFNWFWDTLWRFRAFYVESMVATMVANVLTLASSTLIWCCAKTCATP